MVIMEKTELRDAIARYVQKFGEETKKVQQRLNDANSAMDAACVQLKNGTSLAANILELQNSDCFTDVCINCSDGYFYVHSGILMAASQPILTHFLKTNDPENFDSNGRRHLDLKSFSVVETASVLFLFYTGTSMHHVLEDTMSQRHEDANGGNHKVLMKILARFGTNTSNLAMSLPVTGSTFPSRCGNPVTLRFCRKDNLQKTTEDFLISQEGEIRPAPPAKQPSLTPLITPAALAEDCNFCPIVCTPTSSRKVHLEDCKYAVSKKNNEECKLSAGQNNSDDHSAVKSTKLRSDNQGTPATVSNVSADPAPPAPSTVPKPMPTSNETKGTSKGPSASMPKSSGDSKTPKSPDCEVIFIKPEPADTIAAFEQLNATKVQSIPPPAAELSSAKSSPAVVTPPTTVEDKPKPPPARKEPQLTNIRRTFNDCQGATVKRKKPTEGGAAISRDKPLKENKNNRRQTNKESSSDSEYEEPPRPRKKSYLPSPVLNTTEVRSPVVVLNAKDVVKQKYVSPKPLPPQRTTRGAGPPPAPPMKTLNAVANGMKKWAASKGGPRKSFG